MKQLSIAEIALLLQSRRLPARLNALQAGVILGFPPFDITVLTTKKMLRPLGKPAQNSTKYFAAREIEKLANDIAWLRKATQVMQAHWTAKNGSRNPSASKLNCGTP